MGRELQKINRYFSKAFQVVVRNGPAHRNTPSLHRLLRRQHPYRATSRLTHMHACTPVCTHVCTYAAHAAFIRPFHWPRCSLFCPVSAAPAWCSPPWVSLLRSLCRRRECHRIRFPFHEDTVCQGWASASLSCSKCRLDRRWFSSLLPKRCHPSISLETHGQDPWAQCFVWVLGLEQRSADYSKWSKAILTSPGHLKLNRNFLSEHRCWTRVEQWQGRWGVALIPRLVLGSSWPAVTCLKSLQKWLRWSKTGLCDIWHFLTFLCPFLAHHLAFIPLPAQAPFTFLQPLRQNLQASGLLLFYLWSPPPGPWPCSPDFTVIACSLPCHAQIGLPSH